MVVKMTRAEYEAKYGQPPPIKMTRAEYEAKYGQPPSKPTSTNQPSSAGSNKILDAYGKFSDTLGSVSVGSIKETLGTAANIGSAISPRRIATPLNPLLAKALPDTSITETIKTHVPGADKLLSKENLTPQGTAEKVGFYGTRIGEALAISSPVKSLETSLKTTLAGAGLLKAAARVTGGAAIEAGAFGGLTLAQTADPKQARNAALFAGGLKAVTGTIGEVARAYRIPEKIYQRIFKATYADMADEMRSAGIDRIRTTNPKLYQDLLDAGIVKLKNGTPIVDETLAKQALDRGLSGSLTSMSDSTVSGLLKSELRAQEIVKNANGTVGMKEANFLKLFRTIQQEYADVGFGETSQQAKQIADAIVRTKGKVDPQTALEARRLLDHLRVASSYKTMPPKLSLSQENLKQLSDVLRGRVNKVPGMSQVMKDYSFYIDAAEALAREAKRQGNNQVISLVDAVLATGGLATGNLSASLPAIVARRLTTMPSVLTNIAQQIQNGTITTGGALIKGAFPQLFNDPSQR